MLRGASFETRLDLLPFGKGTDTDKSLYELFKDKVTPPSIKKLNIEVSKISKRYIRVLTQHHPILKRLINPSNFKLTLKSDICYTFQIHTKQSHIKLIDEQTSAAKILISVIRSSPLFRAAKVEFEYVVPDEGLTKEEIIQVQKKILNQYQQLLKKKEYQQWKSPYLFDTNSLSI